MRRTWMKVAGIGLVAATAMGPATTVGAAPKAAEEHCVLVVLGKEASGRLRKEPMQCAATPAEARALAAPEAGAGATDLADWAIGTHYDGAGFTGSSVTVWGADCTGGWLNLPSDWNDRISSTLHGCPRIKHHLHVGLSGSSQTTASPGGNLGSTLNNETSSIQYLS